MDSTCFALTRPTAEIAHLQLSRPERLNNMPVEFWLELPDLVRHLEREGGTRVLVISSTGKHFSAGMDLSVFGSSSALGTETVNHREQFRQQLKALQETFSALANARFPVIAVVQGGCIGGAVDLVTACCLRFCSKEAFFQIAEINLGMMADVGTLNRAPKQLPEAIIRELAYTGGKLAAERAYQLGFVNAVGETPEAALALAMQCAQTIASKAPIAIAASKEMISYTRDHSVAESFTFLNALQPSIFDAALIQQAAEQVRRGQAPSYQDIPALLPPINPAVGRA
jgi:enoyl-CoA hydratase